MSIQLSVAWAEQLRRDLLTGVYKPGEKLIVRDLKERYSAGATPIREVLSRLVGEGLVVVENNRGFRVRPLSKDDLYSLYEARAAIESALVKLAFQRGDDAWEAQVVAAHYRLEKWQVTDGPADWDLRHRQFHQSIVSGAQSDYLMSAREQLFDSAQRYRLLWVESVAGSDSERQQKTTEHQRILQQVINRDVSLVDDLHEHLLTPLPVLEAYLT